MLVHSCYVDNGFGDRVDILDENGCGLDAVIKIKKIFLIGQNVLKNKKNVFFRFY
jgi:hypothetical protein